MGPDIQGLLFFLPAYKAKNEDSSLWAMKKRSAGLATILAAQMEVLFFPVIWS